MVPKWPRGVTVSTLDSESSDRGSNPRETSCMHCCQLRRVATAAFATMDEHGAWKIGDSGTQAWHATPVHPFQFRMAAHAVRALQELAMGLLP